ncbi:MAG: outer membrane beta-barrel protein [Bacteroidota bacterium]
MKKYFLLSFAIVILPSMVSLAQDNPYLGTGRSFVGGGLSVTMSDDENAGNGFTNRRTSRINSFGISPTYGKFFSDRWAYGVSFSVGFSNNEQVVFGDSFSDRSIQKNTTVGLTPFLRRFLPLTERFGAYVQPQLSYAYRDGSSENSFRDTNSPENDQTRTFDIREHRVSLGMQAGLYYFVTQHFSVETSLLDLNFSYNSSNRERVDPNAQPGGNDQLSNTTLQVNLINQISLDRILILNYYF